MAKPKPKPKGKRVTISKPPPGTYDPALDAQERAANRGLGDLISDVDLQRSRGSTDFILSGEDLARQRSQFGEDIARERTGVESSYGRNLSDLLTQRTQAQEDYTRNLAQLQRNYDILGQRQAQTARAAGVAQGGAGAQAARKRAENQAWERAPIDTDYNRFTAASQLSEQRLGEDRSTALADLLRAEQRGYGDIDRSGGQLNLNYQRSNEDLTTQLARAKRENIAFGQDIAEARQAQYGGPISVRLPKAKTPQQQYAAQQKKVRQQAARAQRRAQRRARAVA